jgi:hypothetical protein
VPVLPPLRTDGTSTAAMMAILSPPVTPFAATSNRPRPAAMVSPKTPSALTLKPDRVTAPAGLAANLPRDRAASMFAPREGAGRATSAAG